MSGQEQQHRNATYVVRISRDDAGGIKGVVVRVSTGERFPFSDLDHMGVLLRERVEMDMSVL